VGEISGVLGQEGRKAEKQEVCFLMFYEQFYGKTFPFPYHYCIYIINGLSHATDFWENRITI
jgi:hypothetical protein